MRWVCKCGHPRSEHTGFSGPNSIGQWFHGQCVNGSVSHPPYRVGGCRCYKFTLRLWPILTRVRDSR